MILFIRNIQNRQMHGAQKEKGGCWELGHERGLRVTARSTGLHTRMMKTGKNYTVLTVAEP